MLAYNLQSSSWTSGATENNFGNGSESATDL